MFIVTGRMVKRIGNGVRKESIREVEERQKRERKGKEGCLQSFFIGYEE